MGRLSALYRPIVSPFTVLLLILLSPLPDAWCHWASCALPIPLALLPRSFAPHNSRAPPFQVGLHCREYGKVVAVGFQPWRIGHGLVRLKIFRRQLPQVDSPRASCGMSRTASTAFCA